MEKFSFGKMYSVNIIGGFPLVKCPTCLSLSVITSLVLYPASIQPGLCNNKISVAFKLV